MVPLCAEGIKPTLFRLLVQYKAMSPAVDNKEDRRPLHRLREESDIRSTYSIVTTQEKLEQDSFHGWESSAMPEVQL